MRLFFWRKLPDSTPDQQPQRWRWFGGRRMLTTPYVMPKDEREGDRLNLQHHLLKVAAQGTYRAPLRQVRAILDVACGTGIWAREMAQAFPDARVVGFDYDRSPLERALAVLGPSGQFPSNFRFVEANMFERFPFENEAFDYTFSRFLVVATPTDKWPHIAREMARVTRPGGYVEMVDMQQFPVTQSPAYNRVLTAAADMVKQRGMQAGVEQTLKGYLEQAGLQRVQRARLSGWRGTTAGSRAALADQRFVGRASKSEGGHGQLGYFSEDEFDALIKGEEQESPRYGVYLPVIYTFGRKP